MEHEGKELFDYCFVSFMAHGYKHKYNTKDVFITPNQYAACSEWA